MPPVSNPSSHGSAPAPMEERPERFAPDRREAVCAPGEAGQVELASGVVFQPLVGAHNDARNLTTGLVTFGPRSALPCHRHTFPEAVTVLSGELVMAIEGRGYRLGPLDAVAIPAGVAHAAENESANELARVHIAMASHEPRRELVPTQFTRCEMPRAVASQGGGEHITWHDLAEWHSLGDGTRFKDYYNAALGVPGMSGGYARFVPGGRLPCHLHDFDESITIVEGQAVCLVEGRTYDVADCATVFVPRGRCHYFINRSNQPMAMIWVYAGDMPERLVIAERWCSERGAAKERVG